MRPRQLELPSLIKLLIDEHKKSREKLSRIEQLSIKGDYTETRNLVDELRTHIEQHIIDEEAIILKEALRLLGREDCKDVIEVFQQHKLIINFVHQYINLLDSPQSGVNIIKELRKLIDLHYEKEEAEIFPRILELYLREKSG
ncbi:MAG: hemerythrin domain-containing protein [Thaumarchaeota archaeon]|nr:hemerythrin domain-containing protein [Candidatus Geocrenenecus arthurdayi]MCL7391196.1 hemerythrin domain-containing protein [Candidatus Geocrenenecus arthurdayi]MCL7396394.1 hemerythrin domain-containing protein [Candidatus Geocrenenecus arthurdayi]MCL7403711.1 hemerythrin domain-containing protein [Candidatus Geocrenenecus arthurdayi]